MLKLEVSEQEDTIKHLKRSKADKDLIMEAATTLIRVKKALSLAEVQELIKGKVVEMVARSKGQVISE